jgi:chromosome segregation ATPase
MSTTNTNFDGIHVSKGFVRGLQGQVFRLEQNQQSLIQQLEHANNLATEYHAAAVAWQHKHDTALHEMEKTKQALGHERTEWNSSLNHVVDLYEREKKLRLEREHEMTHLEQLLAEQIEMSTSRSPSPAHRPHRNKESLPPHEPMSPVSIPDDYECECEHEDDNDSALNEFYGNYYPNDAYSSRTTDCSGDPICHSDSD